MIVEKIQVVKKSFRLHQANHHEQRQHQQQQEVQQQQQLKLKPPVLKQQLLAKKITKSILMFLEPTNQNPKGKCFNLMVKSVKIA